MIVRGVRGLSAGLVLALLVAEPLAAQTVVPPDANGITHPSIATSLPSNGDPAGSRKSLSDHGITYNFIYTNDVLSNLSGGIKRGTIDQGKLEGQLTIDLAKLAGWQDLTIYANAFQIHNTGRFRRDYVGGLNTIAAIEANQTTRLCELASSPPIANSSSATSAICFCNRIGRPLWRSICRAAVLLIRCRRRARA
jgi:carbohydrate-selective porin OprB